MPVDYLLGQKDTKMVSLPPAAAAVPCRCAAAAEVDARAAPPHRHRAAWFGAHLRSPAAASRPCAAGAVKRFGCIWSLFAARGALLWYIWAPLGLRPLGVASDQACQGSCMWTVLHGNLIIWALGEVLSVCVLSS